MYQQLLFIEYLVSYLRETNKIPPVYENHFYFERERKERQKNPFESRTEGNLSPTVLQDSCRFGFIGLKEFESKIHCDEIKYIVVLSIFPFFSHLPLVLTAVLSPKTPTLLACESFRMCTYDTSPGIRSVNSIVIEILMVFFESYLSCCQYVAILWSRSKKAREKCISYGDSTPIVMKRHSFLFSFFSSNLDTLVAQLDEDGHGRKFSHASQKKLIQIFPASEKARFNGTKARKNEFEWLNWMNWFAQ